MFPTFTLKQLFSINPTRSKRFFTLTMNLNPSIPVSQTLLQSHNQLLRQNEQQGAILLAVKSLQTQKFVYFFQSKNQIEPFQFYKQWQNPLTLHNLVETYKIEEIQIKNRVRDKELAPNYLRE